MAASLVSAVRWDENEGVWSCSLVCSADGFGRIRLLPSSQLSFRVLQGRFCTGFTRLSKRDEEGVSDSWKELSPCPDGAQLQHGTRCRKCTMLDVTRACLRCAGGDCQAPREVREACEDGSAYVYLAAFGSGIVKAGVSQGSRVVKRWIEQGADVASRVLVGNGREVRRFERRIQRELGVLTSVKGTQKMNILVSDADVLRARELLLQFGEEVYRTFPEAHCFHEEPQLLLPYYRIPPLDNRPLLLRIQPGLEVSGEILAVKGPVMLIKEGELPFALNLNDLVGRKLETTRASQKETQAALDSFLLRQHSHC